MCLPAHTAVVMDALLKIRARGPLENSFCDRTATSGSTPRAEAEIGESCGCNRVKAQCLGAAEGRGGENPQAQGPGGLPRAADTGVGTDSNLRSSGELLGNLGAFWRLNCAQRDPAGPRN